MKGRLLVPLFGVILTMIAAGPGSGVKSASADTVGTATQMLGPLATLDATTLIPASDPALTDPAASEPATTDPAHLPRGGNYKLFGAAKNAVDPQNRFNEVISFDTMTGCPLNCSIAGAFRKLGDHVQVGMLSDLIELKYYFVGSKGCGGGSPRFQLGISLNGDGKFDANAFGYISDSDGFQTGCATVQHNKWVYEDMTNTKPKWGLDKFAPASDAFCALGHFNCTWSEVVTFFNTVYPNHEVLDAVLVDDSAGFTPPDQGCAFYDLVSTGALTLTDHSDTTGNGSAPNNC